jgi:outer membrane biosynthesis protein TonB
MASQLYQPEWRDRSSIARKPMEEIAAFIKWTITYYKEMQWKDYDLWEGFLDDYCSFTLETFRNCDINTIKNIREHLRQNGVYVRKSRGIEVAKILLELLQENEPAKWPANDLPTATATGTSATQPTGTTLFVPYYKDTPPQIDNIVEQPQLTATATIPLRTQTPTPTTPQPPTTLATPMPKQAAPTVTQQQHYPRTSVASIPPQPAQQQYDLPQPTQQQHNFQQSVPAATALTLSPATTPTHPNTVTIDWEPDKGRPISTSTFFNYYNIGLTLEAEGSKGEDLFREDEGLPPKMYWCITGD